jgi:hypothetical protein
MGVPPVSPGGSVGYDCSFKILLIGDSAVGKSSLLLSFVAAAHLDDDIAPTIGTFSLRPVHHCDRLLYYVLYYGWSYYAAPNISWSPSTFNPHSGISGNA